MVAVLMARVLPVLLMRVLLRVQVTVRAVQNCI
jgi:hypothetical protein